MKRRADRYSASVLLCALWSVAGAMAGPITPPPGPVASTHKTLSDIEPRIAINSTNTPGDADSVFRITAPGSYYLTGNVVGTGARHGIEIAADSVVLDLNGFAVIHSGGGLDGISTAGVSRVSITVRNGVASAWGDRGIELTGTGHIVEGVHARVNGDVGILVGDNAVVRGCQASSNGEDGILVGEGSTVSGCAAARNGAAGIDAIGASVTECAALENQGNGIEGGLGTSIANCEARENTGRGFSLSNGGSITNSAAYFNTGGGFNGSTGVTISDCAAFNNLAEGFNVGSVSSVIDCNARSNSLDGIRAAGECVVRGNSCTGNGPTPAGGSGILVTGAGGTIEGNTCAGNDEAGIHVTGNENRIDGNSCTNNALGIDVDGIDNLVIRNTASGNAPNYSIVAGNSVGPRVSVANSDGWAGITNANHPWANLGY